jgi:hypothetical protein
VGSEPCCAWGCRYSADVQGPGTGSHGRGEQIFRWCTFKADLVTKKKIEEIYGEEIPCYSILLKNDM